MNELFMPQGFPCAVPGKPIAFGFVMMVVSSLSSSLFGILPKPVNPNTVEAVRRPFPISVPCHLFQRLPASVPLCEILPDPLRHPRRHPAPPAPPPAFTTRYHFDNRLPVPPPSAPAPLPPTVCCPHKPERRRPHRILKP